MATRYALNKNKYLLDPEVDHLQRLLDQDLGIQHFTDSANSANIAQNPGFLVRRRDALVIQLALRTGARASEILALRHADLNSYDQTVFIHGIKGSNDRELPIQPRLFEILQSHCAEIPRNQNLFDFGYHRLRQIWDVYRPAAKKFHCLRHTFAIRLYRKTKDIRLVQVALGHRNITNTMIYADYVYSQTELRKLIL